MSPFFVLGWEHSSRFGEERSPHVSEHCVQQMSHFLLLLQLLVSPRRKGWEAVLRRTVRVIMERSGHSFKDAVVWFHCYWMEEGKIGVVFVFTQCGLLTYRWARVTLGKSCLQTSHVPSWREEPSYKETWNLFISHSWRASLKLSTYKDYRNFHVVFAAWLCHCIKFAERNLLAHTWA